MENSANDTYLIVNRADTSAKHIAYRNALYATLCDRIPGADFSGFSAERSALFSACALASGAPSAFPRPLPLRRRRF